MRSQILFCAPWKVFSVQPNSPSSSSVTLKIINVALCEIHVTLNLPSKPETGPAFPVSGMTVPTSTLFKVKSTAIILKSGVRLNFQFSCTLVDPLRRGRPSAVSSVLWSDVVSTGRGSYHVTLPAPEIKKTSDSQTWHLTENEHLLRFPCDTGKKNEGRRKLSLKVEKSASNRTVGVCVDMLLNFKL